MSIGGDVKSSVSVSAQKNRECYTISFLPWFRCYEIGIARRGTDKPVDFVRVPESWCTAVPFEPWSPGEGTTSGKSKP